MKKIIFLLLCTVSFYGQTLQNPTYGTVTVKNSASDTTPAYFVTSQTDGVYKKTPAATVEKTANKQNSLATDGTGTKYPTVDAVNAGVVKLTGNQSIAGDKTIKDAIILEQGADFQFQNSTFKTSFNSNTLTADRGINLPDKDGVVALISDITGSINGTTNYLPKFTSANVLGNSQIIDNGTNVGIGTVTPYGKFVVNNGVDRNLFLYTDASVSGTDGMAISSLNDATTLYKPLVFQGSKIVLGMSGNVGIGTNSPTYDLSVERTTEPAIGIFRIGSSNYYRWKTDGYKSTIGTSAIDHITLSDGGGIKVGTSGNVAAMTIQPLAPVNTIYASNLGNVGIGVISEVSLGVNGTSQVIGGSTISNIAPFHAVYALGDSQTYAGFYESNLQTLIGNNFRVKNRGLNGNSTGEMLARLNTDVIQMVDAEYIIVWGGINDVLRDYPASTIKTNLQTIYNNAHKAGLKVITINLTPFGNYSLWNSTRQAVADDVNNWIATTSTLVDYRIDAHTLLKDPSNPLILLPAYDLDHLHVNEAGHIVLAGEINSIVGTWTTNPNTNSLNVTGNAIIEQQLDQPASLSLNPNSNALGRWKKWELTAGNSSTSYDFNIGVTGGNNYLTIQGADAGANAGNVGIGTTPYAKFVVHDTTNRNLAILSDAGQAGFSGMALASFNDAFSANVPLSIIGSSIQIAGGNLAIIPTPTTSAGGYDILTRNTSTGIVEKILSNTIAHIDSPTLTGTPTAPTAPVGTNTTQIATTAFVLANNTSLSGKYTPTAVAGSNITGTPITVSHTYTKVGNIVTVYGLSTPTTTGASVASSYTITLPIARATSTSIAIGFGRTIDTGASELAPVTINSSSTTTATIGFTSTSSGGIVCRYSFQYDITD